MKLSWIKRRWMEFRWGHGTYLAFLLGMTNFTLIVYRLLIEQIPFLSNFFPHLYQFVIVFAIVYIPLAIVVGHWHRLKQLSIDQTLSITMNPITMEHYKRLEEIEPTVKEIHNMLKEIKATIKNIKKN